MKASNWFLLIIAAVLTLATLVVFPLDQGILANKAVVLGLDLQGGLYIVYEADLSGVDPGERSNVMDGVAGVISNRINPLGVTEPLIERHGDNQVAVQLPGTNITEAQKERLGRIALLEFREQITDAEGNTIWIPATGTINGEEKVLTSSYFKGNTYVGYNESGNAYYLNFEWNDEGAQLSEQITGRLIGKQLGIFEGDDPLLGDEGQHIAPVVNSVITTSGQITGLRPQDALQLSSQLNAGRLPVPLTIIYEETVSPTLGSDFVRLAVLAGLIGLAMVFFFMSVYYRIPGIVASIALVYYSILTLAIFKLFGVTLTLAAIGGFVVSVGMAVDANVLIFERMKEELLTKRTLRASLEAGFSRAWAAIWDSNLTTVIACIILYWVGNSIAGGEQVKGFALTLAIGVVASMFTAIIVTRSLLRLTVGTGIGRHPGLFSPIGGKNV
ncbi:MAG: protein translocase subunit SecD [Dehalococcoidia bacterium]|nr:protein translocase subunit SecD [Dehalococcoidia bacterium]